MIVVNIKNLNSVIYQQFIHHILNNSDEISFQFPGVDSNGESLHDEVWQRYHTVNKHFIETLYKNNAIQTISKSYQGMKLGCYGKIIYVKPFEKLNNLILKNHLYDFLVENDLPEDLCFYKNKKLRYFSCSHEEDFCIYNEKKEDVSFLKDNQFDFWIHK